MAEVLLLYCRPGFEREVAQEATAAALEAGIEGFVKAKPDSGYAAFQAHDDGALAQLVQQVDFSELVFARQVVREARFVGELAAGERIAPIVEAARALGTRFNGLWIETPDTNDGKALSALTRPLLPHLEKALASAGLVFDEARSPDRMHVFFVGGGACYVGVSAIANSAPWPMGIPRLRMPRGAPSRSALKLAEALLVFLGNEEAAKRLQPGMTAVDLGASPGGWSWQLAQRHIKVTAVDNGPMDAQVLDTGLVKHRREDGLRFRPADPVDWMVCDMVEKPARVAELVGRWIREGWCRECIFNLKLPMKKRREEVLLCRERIDAALGGVEATLRVRHLYHDREEVTGHLASTRARPS